MKKISLGVITLGLLSCINIEAADSLESWFKDGKVKGNIKYYFIETNKDHANTPDTSAYANSVGGQLSYTTSDFHGLSSGATFMTTNGFALPGLVDASIIGRDNGVRVEGSPGGKVAQESFSILGEAFVNYKYENLELLYGRKVIKTPLVNAKVVRLLPSAVQGAFVKYNLNEKNSIEVSYLTHFKQRTSDKFIDIIKHALGSKTKEITGSNGGGLAFADYKLKAKNFNMNVYDYYANNFINSAYIGAKFNSKLSKTWKYGFAAQYINQMSIGNANTNLAKTNSATGGKAISTNAFGLKANIKNKESNFALAYTKVLRDSNKHDSLVMPYDGTPLFTNMITSNSLFMSNYGKGLTSDSVYIGGSQGIKLTYGQKYGFIGLKNFKTTLTYLNTTNARFKKAQQDYNIVLGYAKNKFSLALKGIWVMNNSSMAANGTVSQLKQLTQYRVIANYKF